MRTIPRRVVSTILLTAAALLVGSQALAQKVLPAAVPAPLASYSVACDVFATESGATAAARVIEEAGFGPVAVRALADTEHEVIVGKCENKTDAVILINSLKAKGVKVTRLAVDENASAQDFSTNMKRPDEALLKAPEARFPAGVAFNAGTRADTEQLRSSLRSKDTAAVHEMATALKASLPDSDPAKGWVLKESGKNLVETGGKAAPALPDFLKVARGEVAASPEDRREAKMLAADSWHYFYFKPLKSYEAYQEILAQEGHDPAIKARCMVEIAACLLELARSEKATFDDVRRYCVKLRHDVAPEFTRSHAVADLIYCESLMYEGRKEEALAEFDGFAARHPGRTREISQANINQGVMFAQMGDWPRAQQFFRQNMTMDFSDPEENFYWQGKRWNMRQRAADYLAFYAAQFQDEATKQEAEQYLASNRHLEMQPIAGPDFSEAFPHTLYQTRIAQEVRK